MINAFYERWKDKGDEKSDTQIFWLELIHDVLGIQNPGQYIEFERRVDLEHVSFIDAYIPSTGIIIEQKSRDVNLDLPAKQSDGTSATPFMQAKRYYDWLNKSEQGDYIIVCNFKEIRIYNMNKLKGSKTEPITTILLEDIERRNLDFLVKPERELTHEEKISLEAGRLAGRLYEAMKPRYKAQNADALRSLNIFCVRIVFLLYAEDSGLFPKSAFHDYLNERKNTARDSILKLFHVLSQKEEERDPYLEDEMKMFPYLNGGLFEEEIEIPKIDGEPLEIIIKEMSEGFNWNEINPTIFGALFESTLNPDTRIEGGMHYTTIRNIHRVINPLFLDELTRKFESLIKNHSGKSRITKLIDFQNELASLTFLDPACGSGNFLTESYLSLRRLENEIIKELSHGQIYFAEGNFSPIKVSISQFYGIEINDFAVSVARTALYIAEHQMRCETEKIVMLHDSYTPLKTYQNIHKANAVQIEWSKVINAERLHYIMGNPPFYGHQWRTEQQNEDMKKAFHDLPDYGKLDYVCAWYNKAADFTKGTEIKTAFVSTNSVSQGESVSVFWKFLLKKGIHIFLAYRPFLWENESEEKAHVHCVIVGITHKEDTPKYIYSRKDDSDSYSPEPAEHINGYLLNMQDTYMINRGASLTDGMPRMKKGSQPTDGGHLILSPEERDELLKKYPEAEKFIRRYMSGKDFLYDNLRYCLWLLGVEPGEYRHIKPIMHRLELVAEVRRKSSTKSVREAADTPMIFTQIRQPESDHFMVIPQVSSERRQYIPMGFMTPDVIVDNQLQVLPDADLFMFGVMESYIHTAWVDVVAGRLEMRYRYSPFVYNCFPWPSVNDKQRGKIESTAQGILDARKQSSKSTLADMYDPLSMPPGLRKAHRANDEAVRSAYGFRKGITEFEIVSELFGMYNDLIMKAR